MEPGWTVGIVIDIALIGFLALLLVVVSIEEAKRNGHARTNGGTSEARKAA